MLNLLFGAQTPAYTFSITFYKLNPFNNLIGFIDNILLLRRWLALQLEKEGQCLPQGTGRQIEKAESHVLTEINVPETLTLIQVCAYTLLKRTLALSGERVLLLSFYL